MINKFRSIIYVNYSPYENSGKILDFLLENFEYVFLFSLGFYNITKKKKLNKLFIYHRGKLKKEYSMIQLPVPQQLVFFLLPLRSFITFIQVLLYSFKLKEDYGKVGIYFTVNGFTAWIGNISKIIGLVDKTVFWVWDYYPPTHNDKIIMLMRRIYLYFDSVSLRSDKVAFINNRILNLREKSGILPKDKNFLIVPIGTDDFNNLKKKVADFVTIGFIGVLKKSQGLDEVFNNAQSIIEKFPKTQFEVVGSGPDEEYFKQKALHSPLKTTFHGYLEGESFNSVLEKCTIGIATYLPDPSNVSHFGDPGKVKRYLSLGLPVVITDIFEFSKEIEACKAGVIIKYGKSKEFADAIKKIMSNYKQYQRNALKLAKKFYYKKIYPDMFNFS